MKIEQHKIIKLFAETKSRRDIEMLLENLTDSQYLHDFTIIAEELNIAINRIGCHNGISLGFLAVSKFLNAK